MTFDPKLLVLPLKKGARLIAAVHSVAGRSSDPNSIEIYSHFVRRKEYEDYPPIERSEGV